MQRGWRGSPRSSGPTRPTGRKEPAERFRAAGTGRAKAPREAQLSLSRELKASAAGADGAKRAECRLISLLLFPVFHRGPLRYHFHNQKQSGSERL